MRILVLTLLAMLALLPAEAAAAEDAADLWFFWGEGCPSCKEAAQWLDTVTETYPDLVIHRGEVWQDMEERERYLGLLEERGVQGSWVPCFILGDKVWHGFYDGLIQEMEGELADFANPRQRPPREPAGVEKYRQMPVVAATMLIAFADGFNPCSLWVLTMLLAIVLHSSRFKTAVVGSVFLLVTGTIYGLFIAGVFAVMEIIDHLVWIRWVAALLALGVAALNIKDFFCSKKGLSLAIPQGKRPGLFRAGRELTKERPLPMVLVLTAGFAAGAALLELPCTAGFPVVWTNLAAEAGVSGPSFIALLLVYLLVYLSIEIAIVITAIITQRVFRLQEHHGRSLKLFGGTLMAAMAAVLIFKPAIMEGLQGSLAVIVGALLTAGIILLAQRKERRLHQAKQDF